MTGRGDVVPSVKPDLPATEDFLGRLVASAF